MGDRTHVELWVLQRDAARVSQLLNYQSVSAQEIEKAEDDNMQIRKLHFDDVNYGMLDGLEKLKEEGIPFSSYWSSGNEFGTGVEHFRINESYEADNREINDDDLQVPYAKLAFWESDARDLADLGSRVRAFVNDMRKLSSVLPWDTQTEERCKAYRAKKLITKE